MSRLVPALAAVAALAVGPVGEAAPRGGKVVRVERHSRRALGKPRYCVFAEGDLTDGACYGAPVEPGETITIVSSEAVVAQLRVTHVTPEQSCAGGGGSWSVAGELQDDPLPLAAGVATGTGLGGVVDGGLDPRRAKMVTLDASPSGRQTDSDFIGYDTDGDGRTDLMFDHFMCDAQGQPSQGMTAQCYEVWSVQPHTREQRRLRLDVVPQC